MHHCGEDAPGLELVAGKQDKFIAPQNHVFPPSNYSEISLVDEDLKILEPDFDTWKPVMSPGDVLFFHDKTIHRNYLSPCMCMSRISIEVRCCGD